MSAHSALTGSDLHEPKGVASANSGEVYVANGAGSGTWTKINALSSTGKRYFNFRIDDISTAASHWMVPGVAGDITAITSVIDGTIATGDTTLSFEIGGTAVTDGDITITEAGSAAGDVDSSTPSAANTLTATDPIEIISDGASTNTVAATLTFEIDIS